MLRVGYRRVVPIYSLRSRGREIRYGGPRQWCSFMSRCIYMVPHSRYVIGRFADCIQAESTTHSLSVHGPNMSDDASWKINSFFFLSVSICALSFIEKRPTTNTFDLRSKMGLTTRPLSRLSSKRKTLSYKRRQSESMKEGVSDFRIISDFTMSSKK